ncbi:MAG: PAS domain S-box protein [Desulfobacteraceae bacterium]|nr:MAG: PAS domain S-box protein [Desulfobacteraceae bacterium]
MKEGNAMIERKQADDALQEREEKFRIVADFTYDWEEWIGPDGQYLYVSPSCERVSGYTPEEFRADPSLMGTIVHPEDRELYTAHLAEHLNADAREPAQIEFRIVTREGGERWIEHVCQTVHDAQGKWLGRRSSNRDITKRKEAEAALIESEKRFRDLYENAPIAYVSVDPKGIIRRCNRRAGELLGCAAEELVGREVLELYADTEHGREKAQKVLRRFQAGEAVLSEELQMRKADGNLVWVSLTVDPVRDAQGRAVMSRSMAVDITARKQAEEALRESEKRVRRKLDAILSPEARIEALELSDIVDVEKIQKLMDEFYRLTHVGIGIIDLHGKVLVGTGWQDICTKYHRNHPDSCRLCIESDLELSRGVTAGTFKQYRCKNNMWDIATPIMLGGKHVGNIFLGQFLLDKEIPDYEAFREQARRYGFDEEEYIQALDRVPRWSRETVHAAMSFYTSLAAIVGDLSFANIKLAGALAAQGRVEEELKGAGRIMQARLRLLELAGSCSMDELLKAALDEMEALTGSTIGFYHFLEADQRTLSLQSWSTNTLKTMCTASGKGSHYSIDQAGVWVDCVSLRRPVIHNDYASLPHRKGTPEGHAPVVRELVVPIFRSNQIKAIIGVGNKPGDYDEKDIAVVSQLGDLSWDIVERKHAEEAKEQAERRYRSIFENAAEGIFQTTPGGRYLVVNPALARIHGYETPEELMSNVSDIRCQHYVNPEDRSRFQKAIEKHGFVNGFLAEEYRRDGSKVWVSINARAVRAQDGRILYYEGTVEDITDRKRVEEILRTNEQRYRMAQAISHVGNWEYNLQTTHFWGSDEAKRIYGFDPEQDSFSTEEVENCIPERERVHQALIDLIEAGKPYSLEFEIRPRNSSEPRIITSVAELQRDAQGDPLLVVGVIQDVTKRKGAEEEIRRLNQELEQRVRDRTAQLEAANKELEAFAYSVSHDLRAPLRHVDGFIELLRRTLGPGVDDKSRYYMELISGAAQRMGTLIDDLLSFSRMGRVEMSKVPVDLAVLAQEVIRELEPDAEGRGIRWRVADLPTVSGDRAMLRVVLFNLISNALKFTRLRPCAEIEIGSMLSESNETVVFVRDNGAGFDMEYADKLFGVFQRLHGADEFEGVGIGLANVRRIVRRHGGKTWAEGRVNQGATIFFSLPRSDHGAGP